MYFSQFKNILSTKPSCEISVDDFLERIKNPTNDVKSDIEKARELYKINKNEYDKFKKYNLACVTPIGTFNYSRKKSFLKEYSGFIYIDSDSVTSDEFKAILNNNNEIKKIVYASWKSLSERGIGLWNYYIRQDIELNEYYCKLLT